jgi:hypothetical protein
MSGSVSRRLLGWLFAACACGPITRSGDERPSWLSEWVLAFDADRLREGVSEQFLFEDDGRAVWRVDEYCPLARASHSVELRWDVDADGLVHVTETDHGEAEISFPYRSVLVEEWDCDELLFNVEKNSDGSKWSFRGRTWGELCFAPENCAPEFCDPLAQPDDCVD